jgi:hypothetical protein
MNAAQAQTDGAQQGGLIPAPFGATGYYDFLFRTVPSIPTGTGTKVPK